MRFIGSLFSRHVLVATRVLAFYPFLELPVLDQRMDDLAIPSAPLIIKFDINASTEVLIEATLPATFSGLFLNDARSPY